jgi:hypothetical protein
MVKSLDLRERGIEEAQATDLGRWLCLPRIGIGLKWLPTMNYRRSDGGGLLMDFIVMADNRVIATLKGIPEIDAALRTTLAL